MHPVLFCLCVQISHPLHLVPRVSHPLDLVPRVCPDISPSRSVPVKFHVCAQISHLVPHPNLSLSNCVAAYSAPGYDIIVTRLGCYAVLGISSKWQPYKYLHWCYGVTLIRVILHKYTVTDETLCTCLNVV